MAVLAGVFALAFAGAPLSAQTADGPANGNEQLASAGPAANTAPAPEHRGDGVAAIVNDTVISDFDVRQREALFIATSGVRPTDKEKSGIHDEVLKQLENERLQILEAQKHNISVSSSEVDKAINNILSDNHMELKNLEEVLKRDGVYISTLREQIATQIAWSKLVQARYQDDIHVTPADVNAELRRLSEGANKPRFRVSEIFLPVDSPEQADKVKKDMDELETQLRMGAPFSAVARQFSQNPTAAQGGDLGWVTEGQLQPELDKALMNMGPGTISVPIRAAGGYYILGVRAREEPEGTKAPVDNTPKYPPGVLPLARLLLPVGPKPPEELMKRAMEAASVIRANIHDCKTLPEMVSKMKGVEYFNLGTMHLNELSEQMQGELAKTTPGETTEPFHSPAGIELIVRCDQAPPQIETFKMPTRDEVEEKLFQDQLSIFARRYMRDLRRDADIETR